MAKPNTYNHTKTRRKKPKARHRSTRDYDFLQYIRIVFKWATANYDLNRGEVEMILYLYPKGTFTKRQFNDFHKVLGIYQMKTFDKMVKEGWINLWRPRKRNETALYSLSSKAKTMCSRMHKFCTGELDVPTTSRSNKLAQEGGARINNYYMDVIKKMNKDRDD